MGKCVRKVCVREALCISILLIINLPQGIISRGPVKKKKKKSVISPQKHFIDVCTARRKISGELKCLSRQTKFECDSVAASF